MIRTFESYDRPENIRELQNIIEYSAKMEEDGIITHCSLPPDFMKLLSGPFYPGNRIRSRVMDAETDAILSSVNTNGWDVKGKRKAARDLNISIRTLYRKLGQYDRKKN